MHVRVPAVFAINLPAAQISRLMGHKKAVRFISRLSAIVRSPRNQTLSSFNYQSRYLRGRHVGVSRRRTDADKKSHGEEKAVHRIRR